MTDTSENFGSSLEQLRVQGRKTVLLIPWLPILIATDFITLIIAGVLSNTITVTDGAVGNLIWWLWLLILAGSLIFLGWRLTAPFYLHVDPDGIEYRHGQLLATHKWSEISSFTVASRSQLFGTRPAVCLRLTDNLGPEVLFAQRLSRYNVTPPFRETTTGWIVLCYLNQFRLPAADIDAALTHFAGPGKRVNR